MKTDTLKKSLLDYAIKGGLSARFRRENNGLNAFDELEVYNDEIREKRKKLEKKLKICEKEFKLEKDKDKKALVKSQIQMLKKELIKCKEITPLNLSEAPFVIPSSWAWVKLGDICEIFTGDSINATEKEKKFTHQTSGLNYIATKDLANDTSITYENGIKIPDEFLSFFKIAKANSTLLCIEGGSAGRKVGFLKENVCFGNKLCCFENIFAFSKFVFYFLQSGEFSKEFNSNINGIIGGVKKESIRHFLIPLPPLYEQQEIVKKLDLLTTLANDFAMTKENLKRIEKRIEKSLLKLALEGSLSKGYRRASPTLCAFDEISTYNDKIREKRKKLEKELKKCEKEFKLEKDKDKKALVKSQIQMLKKELTKCKEITPLNLSEAPFAIPSSWAWVKGCDIFLPIDNTEPQGDFFKYIDIDSIDNKNKKVKSPKTIETKNASSRARRPLEYGDVLFSMVRPYLENIALIDETLADCIASTGFFVCRTNILDSRFLYYLMISPYVVYGLNSFMKGDNSPSIVKDDILNFNYPLPPLQEQKEITQTLDTLFTLKKGLRRE